MLHDANILFFTKIRIFKCVHARFIVVKYVFYRKNHDLSNGHNELAPRLIVFL